LRIDAATGSEDMVAQLQGVDGLMEKTGALGLSSSESGAMRASAAEFILEGLYAHRRISRNEELGFHGPEERRRAEPEAEPGQPSKKRRQYN
jgi:magnesium chelatase subunit I